MFETLPDICCTKAQTQVSFDANIYVYYITQKIFVILFMSLYVLLVDTRKSRHLQLSISMWHNCRSMGKYWRFMGHDAVIVNLEK